MKHREQARSRSRQRQKGNQEEVGETMEMSAYPCHHEYSVQQQPLRALHWLTPLSPVPRWLVFSSFWGEGGISLFPLLLHQCVLRLW